MARIKCAKLIQHSKLINSTPVRIVSSSWNKPPKCVSDVNMINAITSAIKRPYELSFMQTTGLKLNGKWQGVIGQVMDNKSDVAIGSFLATKEMFDSGLLSPPFGYTTPIAIMTGKLSQSSLNNELHVFTSFSVDIWMAIIITIFIIALCYQFLRSNSSITFNNLLSSILLFLTTLLGQGDNKLSHVSNIKSFILVGSTIYLFTILIQCFQSVQLANLVSDPDVEIDSIDDLLDYMESTMLNISLVTSKNLLPLTMYILKSANEAKFKKIVKMITSISNPELHTEIIVNDVIQAKSIWINFGQPLEFILMSNQHLGLRLGSEQYYGTPFGLIYSKKIERTVKNKIDSVIYSLIESGLQKFWTGLHYSRMDLDKIDVENKITLLHTRGVFILIFSIYIILFLILLMEIFFKMLT